MARWRGSLFLLVLLALLARHLWVAAYIHPYADDFSYAAMGMRTTLAERLPAEYQYWNGRYFSNVLVLRGPLVLGLDNGLVLYRLVPVLLLALTLAAIAIALRVFSGHRLSGVRLWCGALLALLLFIHLMPHAGEGFYWYTGAVTYQMANALILIEVAMMLALVRGDRMAHPTVQFLAVLLLIAAIAGCNELAMVFMVLVHAVWVMFQWHGAGRVDRRLWVALGVALVCAAVVLLAPGNAVRGANFPHRHELWTTFSMSILQSGRFLVTWLTDPAFVLASLLFLHWRRSIVGNGTGAGPGRWTLVALPLLVVFLSMVLPYWSMGMLGQHRTVNAALFAFLPLWAWALASWDDAVFVPKGWSIPLMARHQRPIVVAVLAILLLVMRHDRHVTLELADGTLRRYAMEIGAWHGTIRSAIERGATEVHLPALSAPPGTLQVLLPGPDHGHWMNRSMAQYFGRDDLRIVVGPSERR